MMAPGAGPKPRKRSGTQPERRMEMQKVRYRIEYAADKRRPQFFSHKQAVEALRTQGYVVSRMRENGRTPAYASKWGARNARKWTVPVAAWIVPINDPAWVQERRDDAILALSAMFPKNTRVVTPDGDTTLETLLAAVNHARAAGVS